MFQQQSVSSGKLSDQFHENCTTIKTSTWSSLSISFNRPPVSKKWGKI